MPKIIVTIDKYGKVEVDAEGFKGSSCKEATKFIEDMLKDVEMKEKPEMFDDRDETFVNRNA